MPSVAPAPDLPLDRAPEFARRFGQIIASLQALVAARFLRNPRFVTLIVPLWKRLNRYGQRFGRAMTNLAAGRQRKPRASSSSSAKGGPAPARFPSDYGWLIKAIPHEAAACRAHLQLLLDEPGMAALIQASPTAQRLLRPLCHMLLLKPPLLFPARAPKPAPARPPPPAKAPPPARGPSLLETLLARPDPPDPYLHPVPPSCPRARLRWPWTAIVAAAAAKKPA